ncbi:MAG: molybdopterin oxidoreductase [Clostridia bacterium BRH_c25]|nr:MAG: molybdopterin oxidoreductase [Clostridia bacterium BRH_c25]
MVRVNINNRELTASEGSTILKIALDNGIEIPNLCYDENLKSYGACGMCVVEVEGNPKLVRACSTPATNGMIIKTDTERTIAARKTALTLLSSDHKGDCRPPCATACPAHTDCQGYVGLVANGQYDEAIKLVKDVIPLPASIGRVCPHPCETACRRGNVEEPVAIADIKRFIGDIDINKGTYVPDMSEPTGKTVAVAGSGPAGISCAYFLAAKGHKVVLYEDKPYPGGMLRYGIPQYRLPKELLDAEINTLEKMGVDIKCNVKLGEDITISYLKKTYDAVFIAIGAWASMNMGCKGEDMEGVMGGIELLRKATLAEPINLGQQVIVIGGGNTAMDVARTAVRLGAEHVQVLYRRTRAEMPAEEIEIEEAEEEGVEFIYLVAPIEVIEENGRAKAVRCQRMKLGAPDKSGRRSPEPIPGDEVTISADLIVSAIGQKVNAENVKELAVTKKGTISVNASTFETSMPGIFAGGEAVTGPKIAIEAIAQGKNAAHVIDGYLKGEITPVANPCYIEQEDLTPEDFADREKKDREHLKVLPAQTRRMSFGAISETFDEEAAVKEASRCLECGCHDYFECKLVKYIGQYDINTKALKGEIHRKEEADTHPFIKRNAEKCILCGLCFRACEEVTGVTALGLLDRGFDSVVIPEFGLPLEESACISCGHCIDVCPTGACMEKEAVRKQVPVELENTASICSYCGVGCNVTYQSKGSLVFKSLPNKAKGEDTLCAKGRFGIYHINDEKRLVKPVIRRAGNTVEAEFDDAIALAAKKLQLIRGQYGKNSVAMLISPKFTNEEAYVAKKIADKLDTGIAGTMSVKEESGIKAVLGCNASTNSYDELYNTDLIISIGDVAENHPVLGINMKDAAIRGAKLVSISNCDTRLAEHADVALKTENNMEFLKSFIKSLIDQKFADKDKVDKIANGFDALAEYVKNASDDADAAKAAKMYGEARKAIIVVDEDTVSEDSIKLIADAAVITEKVGKPHRGIIIVRSKANTQGIIDMGFATPADQLLSGIERGEIKGAVIIGEDLAGADEKTKELLAKLEFTLYLDIFMTETAKLANIVIPIGSAAESEGTYTRSDRKLQRLAAAVKPFTGRNTFDILSKLGAEMGVVVENVKRADEKIANEVKPYGGLYAAAARGIDSYTPCSRNNVEGSQVLHTKGFMRSDKKANLSIPEGGLMFKERKIYDTVQMKFEEYICEKGLKS